MLRHPAGCHDVYHWWGETAAGQRMLALSIAWPRRFMLRPRDVKNPSLVCRLLTLFWPSRLTLHLTPTCGPAQREKIVITTVRCEFWQVHKKTKRRIGTACPLALSFSIQLGYQYKVSAYQWIALTGSLHFRRWGKYGKERLWWENQLWHVLQLFGS